jgi:hypothetical protein
MGLRDMGGVPRFVDPTIAPGIDITQFLLLNREELLSPAIAVSATGSYTDALVTVPPAELWYVHAHSISSRDLTAGEILKAQPGYFLGTAFFANGDNDRQATPGRVGSAAWTGWWAVPGTQLAIRVNEITTATSINCRVAANVTRLRI